MALAPEVTIIASLLSVMAEYITIYYAGKDFQQRFAKYFESIDKQIKDKTKEKLLQMDKKINEEKSLDKTIEMMYTMAREIEESQEPKRKYIDAHDNILKFYGMALLTIIVSLIQTLYPNATLGVTPLSDISTILLVGTVSLLFIILLTVHQVSHKVLQYELSGN